LAEDAVAPFGVSARVLVTGLGWLNPIPDFDQVFRGTRWRDRGGGRNTGFSPVNRSLSTLVEFLRDLERSRLSLHDLTDHMVPLSR
jgi:hypothetical protein